MLFQFKMPENGRKYRFRDKQRQNNLTLMFLDVKMLTEREQFCIFGICRETTHVQCKKGQQWSQR